MNTAYVIQYFISQSKKQPIETSQEVIIILKSRLIQLLINLAVTLSNVPISNSADAESYRGFQ